MNCVNVTFAKNVKYLTDISPVVYNKVNTKHIQNYHDVCTEWRNNCLYRRLLNGGNYAKLFSVSPNRDTSKTAASKQQQPMCLAFPDAAVKPNCRHKCRSMQTWESICVEIRTFTRVVTRLPSAFGRLDLAV